MLYQEILIKPCKANLYFHPMFKVSIMVFNYQNHCLTRFTYLDVWEMYLIFSWKSYCLKKKKKKKGDILPTKKNCENQEMCLVLTFVFQTSVRNFFYYKGLITVSDHSSQKTHSALPEKQCLLSLISCQVVLFLARQKSHLDVNSQIEGTVQSPWSAC